MTTIYTHQTYTMPQPIQQVSWYENHGQPSPASSTSPQSPRSNDSGGYTQPNPAKQLRPLKSPLYVPAVLRPTEHFPVFQSPTTPPQLTSSSLGSMQAQRQVRFEQDDKFLEALKMEKELGEVTGPPTMEHWKPDEASTSCDSPACKSSFNIFVRRHHCRHCGHIYCSTHASQTVPLDQEAKFHPQGYESRACESCHRQYQRWDTARSMKRKNSNESDLAATPEIDRPASQAIMAGTGSKDQQQGVAGSLAASAPNGWQWSTF